MAYSNSRPISRTDPFGLAPPSVVPPVIGVPAAQQNAMVEQQLAYIVGWAVTASTKAEIDFR
jgi:hypothetical protein